MSARLKYYHPNTPHITDAGAYRPEEPGFFDWIQSMMDPGVIFFVTVETTDIGSLW